MKTKQKVKVDIVDGDELLFTGVIHPLTVALDARRLELTQEILKRDVPDSTKGQLMSCAAFAACIHDEKGALLYPEETAVDDIYESMSVEVYNELVTAYLEVNPVNSKTLKAKKKKF